VRGACAPAAAVVPTHGSISLLALLAMAQELAAWGAGAPATNGAVKITSAAPDAA
jgi:hypothetical protein